MRTRISTFLGLLCVALAAGTAVASRHEIRFDRPAKPGERLRLSAKGSSTIRNSMVLGGQTLREESEGVRIDLEAVVEVLEVNERGGVEKKTLKIARLVYGASGEPDRTIPPGSVITAEATETGTEFELEGGELSELAVEALGIVVETDSKNLPRDDETFGSVDPRVVGESWSVDREVSARALGAVGVPIEPDQIDGTITLVGVEQSEGLECLRIRGDVKFAEFPLGASEPGGQLEASRAQATFSRLLPTDLGIGMLYELSSFRVESSVNVNEGPMTGALVEISFVKNREARTVPVRE